MVLESLCSPALLYLGFSLTQIIIDIMKQMYNSALIKFPVMIIFTLLLNILCNRGLGVVSWVIVFIPFIAMTFLTTVLLYVFGLAPTEGKASNLDDYDQSEGSYWQGDQSNYPAPTSQGGGGGGGDGDGDGEGGDFYPSSSIDTGGKMRRHHHIAPQYYSDRCTQNDIHNENPGCPKGNKGDKKLVCGSSGWKTECDSCTGDASGKKGGDQKWCSKYCALPLDCSKIKFPLYQDPEHGDDTDADYDSYEGDKDGEAREEGSETWNDDHRRHIDSGKIHDSHNKR